MFLGYVLDMLICNFNATNIHHFTMKINGNLETLNFNILQSCLNFTVCYLNLPPVNDCAFLMFSYSMDLNGC